MQYAVIYKSLRSASGIYIIYELNPLRFKKVKEICCPDLKAALCLLRMFSCALSFDFYNKTPLKRQSFCFNNNSTIGGKCREKTFQFIKKYWKGTFKQGIVMDRLTYIHIRIRLHNNFDIIKFNLSWSHFGRLFDVFEFNDVCFSMQSEIFCCFSFSFPHRRPAQPHLRIKQRYGNAEQHLCK